MHVSFWIRVFIFPEYIPGSTIAGSYGSSSQSYGFSSSHVWMWELDYKESRALKNCCFWTVVLVKTLESPLDCKEIKTGNPQGNQSWIFIGRTDAEAEAPILWPPDVKDWLILISSVQFSSVAKSCLTLCNPMNCSIPGLSVHHQLLEFTQTHVHRVCDAIQPSQPLSSPSPPAPNPSQHQSLFQWVNSSHEVAKVLELQL